MLALDSELQDFSENYLSSDNGGWPPDEVRGVVRQIREAVRKRDLAALLDLAVGELNPGPRKAFANTRTFQQFFDEEWRESVLRDAPFCVGWRGCALGGGKVWFAKSGLGIGIYSIHGATPEPRPLIAPAWRFSELVLGPDCFRYESLSSDNVKAVMDRWQIHVNRSSFTRNVGIYLGDPITSFDPIGGGETLWGDILKCAAVEGAFLIDEDAVVRPPSPSDRYWVSGWYRRVARIPVVRCEALAPSLSASCVEANVVLVSETSDVSHAFGSMGPQHSYGAYGVFVFNDGRHFVLPLKWFRSRNEALNWLDGPEVMVEVAP